MNNGEFYKNDLPQLIVIYILNETIICQIEKEERNILDTFELIEQRGPSNQRRDMFKHYQSDELKAKQQEGQQWLKQMKQSYKRHSVIPPTVEEEGAATAGSKPQSKFKKQQHESTVAVAVEEVGTAEDRQLLIREHQKKKFMEMRQQEKIFRDQYHLGRNDKRTSMLTLEQKSTHSP